MSTKSKPEILSKLLGLGKKPKQPSKILVLCSGGLDSTVLLYKAVKTVGAENVVALNIFYGQKHAKEQAFAEWHCQKLNVPLLNADLSDVFRFNPSCSALLEGSDQEISHKSYAEQLKENPGGTVNAYVPYRNGLFLSYAAAVAIQENCDMLYYGAHRDDAAGSAYPDCSTRFIQAQSWAIAWGTGDKVTMEAPWWNMNKAGIVSAGLQLGMSHEDFEHTWSCYEGKESPCGLCGTCRDRKAAFESNGITDIM